MKTILKVIFLFLVMISFTVTLGAKEYSVAIFDYDTRDEGKPSVAQHIKKQLETSGLKFKAINLFTGKGVDNTSLEVLKRIEQDKYDLVITITSDAMEPASYRLKTTPWLFTNVNNPEFFGVGNKHVPGENRSGVSYYISALKQMKLFNQVMEGKIKKVGFIFDYNAKSRNAEVIDFRSAAIKLHMKYRIKLLRNKYELPIIVKKLLDEKVDAIVITSSNKLYNNINLILDQSTQQKVPIFSVNKKGVEQGAIAAISSDYYKMVEENLIPMVIDVLEKGKSPGDLPIQFLKNPQLHFNITQAKKLGLKIPTKLKTKIFKTY